MSKIKKMDFSIAGSIKVSFESGDFTFVSRRFIGKVKEFLEM